MSVLARCPSNRENSYGKMTENRQGPTPGVRLREVSVKRELTVYNPILGLTLRYLEMKGN